MDIIGIIEVFALVTGVPYIVLEVLQKNGMWYFGIATGLACAYSFAIQHVWSNMSLNIYYVVMSVWGLYQWRKDSRLLEGDGGGQDPAVHLGRMDRRTALWSAVTFIAGHASACLAASCVGRLKHLVGRRFRDDVRCGHLLAGKIHPVPLAHLDRR